MDFSLTLNDRWDDHSGTWQPIVACGEIHPFGLDVAVNDEFNL